MSEPITVLIFATVLMSIDLLTTFFVYRLSRRVGLIERDLSKDGHAHREDDVCRTCRTTCAANAVAIGALTAVVSRHTDEIKQGRDMANMNQEIILAAINRIRDDVMASIETRMMPRKVLEAALRDLYNRTTARDPDTDPPLDADVP